MNQNPIVQQSDDIAKFASRLTQKYRSCMVVDLENDYCYSCGVHSCIDEVNEDPSEVQAYSDWLRIFVETEIELSEQARMRWILSVENIRQSLNDVHFYISVTYRNRKLANDECWQRMQVVLLDSDNVGIPSRVMLVQEKINSSVIARQHHFFNSSMFGVLQFSVYSEGLNRWRRFSYLNVNDEALRILGYTQDEFYEGMRSQQIDLVVPQDVATFIDLVTSLEQVGDRKDFHLHVLNRSGYVVAIGGEAELCISDDGRKYVQFIFQDESKTENTREVIADLKKEIEDLTNAIPCAVHRSLMAGKSVTEYVNREFTVLTGYDAIDLKVNFDGTFQSILATPEDVKIFNTGFSRALTMGKRIAVDFNIRKSDGSIIAVRDWLYVTHDKSDRLWLYGSMIENTDEKNTKSRADNFEEIIQYYSQGLNLLSSLSTLADQNRLAKRKKDFSPFIDLLATHSQASVIHYGISGGEAVPLYSNFRNSDDNCDAPVNLLLPHIQKCLNAMKNSRAFIVPNNLVLKAAIDAGLHDTSIFKDVNQMLMIPVAYDKDEIKEFLVIRNPNLWILHHLIPKVVADSLCAFRSR